jgi:hypothetical protein
VTNKPDGCVFCQNIRDEREFSRQPVVIAIQEGNDLAPTFGDPQVKGGSLTAVFFAYIPHPGSESPYNFWRSVGGAVVYNDNFPFRGGKILLQYTVYSPFDESFVVISIDKNTNGQLRQEISPQGPDAASR